MTTFLVYCSKNRDVAVLVTDCSVYYGRGGTSAPLFPPQKPQPSPSLPAVASAAVKTAAAVILVISHT